MALRGKIIAELLCLVALAMLGAGCGSSSGGSDATGPSAEFTGKGGSNRPAAFGQVADEEEREAASKVLEESLKARAAGDWAAQCATLTVRAISQIESDAPNFGGGKGCVSGLKAQAEPLSSSKSVRANTMTGPIAVLRVDGKFGYALYHGAKHQDYAMLMRKEGGEWKVDHLATTEIP